MDKKEFENTILTLKPKLRGHAMFLSKNGDDADDLVQDTYIKALTYYPKIQDFGNINGWLFTILTNLFINKYRKAKKQGTLIDTTPDLYHINLCEDRGDISPLSVYQEKELKEMIESLDVSIREPFRLHVAGWKYDEIAGKLGIKLGTVKSRIFFARKELMKNINSGNFIKTMKTDDFGYSEIMKFREVVPQLLKDGWTRKRIEKAAEISEPTVTKILKLSPENLQLNGHIVDKIRHFNERFYFTTSKKETFSPIEITADNKEAVEAAEQLAKHPYFKNEHKTKELPIEKSENLTKSAVDLLSGDELFWYHIGKALCHKPGNVKVSIITE